MSIPTRFNRREEAVAANWFSRRHKTREAHDAATAAWRQQHPKEMAKRQRRRQRRLAVAA
jgi:hypothetical protein